MKLTRKQLNQILLSLPDPRLVLERKISPVFKVPVHERLAVIPQLLPPNDTIKVNEITFEYSEREMDWVLKDLDLDKGDYEQKIQSLQRELQNIRVNYSLTPRTQF